MGWARPVAGPDHHGPALEVTAHSRREPGYGPLESCPPVVAALPPRAEQSRTFPAPLAKGTEQWFAGAQAVWRPVCEAGEWDGSFNRIRCTPHPIRLRSWQPSSRASDRPLDRRAVRDPLNGGGGISSDTEQAGWPVAQMCLDSPAPDDHRGMRSRAMAHPRRRIGRHVWFERPGVPTSAAQRSGRAADERRRLRSSARLSGCKGAVLREEAALARARRTR
jgi:hypothetical protein